MATIYLEIYYDINGNPFLIEKPFTMGEYLLVKAALKEEYENE